MSGKDAANLNPTQGQSADNIPDPKAETIIESKSVLSEHKGKLAIGVAATLGIMIFYSWRERRLAKEDPEGHARLQRLKASVLTDKPKAGHEDKGKNPKPKSGNNEGQGEKAAVPAE